MEPPKVVVMLYSRIADGKDFAGRDPRRDSRRMAQKKPK